MGHETISSAAPATRKKLLDAATALMREHGFSATTVERICAEAGVTKGAFFHYFKSKEEIGEAAVSEWCRNRAELYSTDLGDPDDDPLVRLDRWLDGLVRSIRDPKEKPVCLLGMMSQELTGANERMREICQSKLSGWTGLVTQLLAAAKKRHPPRVDFDPEQIGWMFNSIWQGSLLIAKTQQDPEVIVNNLRHARAYVDGLFALPPKPKES